eukprot:10019998-Alexandrium_andersonii.AAC.1
MPAQPWPWPSLWPSPWPAGSSPDRAHLYFPRACYSVAAASCCLRRAANNTLLQQHSDHA